MFLFFLYINKLIEKENIDLFWIIFVLDYFFAVAVVVRFRSDLKCSGIPC